MRGLFVLTLILALGTVAAPAAAPKAALIEDFTMQPETRWRFFSDAVMGGVSSGRVVFARDGGRSYARMTGTVSTANRGGFIQMRLELPDPPAPDTRGVRIVVRGNDQRYFVHLRTSGTVLPWQYYQAGFDVSGAWTEIRLPLDSFAPSGGLLRTTPRPQSLRSIAVVAYGRDHDAQIDVAEVAFY